MTPGRILPFLLALLLAGPSLGYEAQVRVVGGQPVVQGAWPFMASLHQADVAPGRDSLMCGASQVAPGWVLTAAHCLYEQAFGLSSPTTPLSPDTLRVYLGDAPLDGLADAQGYALDNYWIHPGYTPTSLENDLALLKLVMMPGQPFAQQTVPLADEPLMLSLPLASQVTVLGWGDIWPADTVELIPSRLHSAQLELYDALDCRARFDGMEDVADSMLCAWGGGLLEDRPDACGGDSGGPLLVRSDQGWTQLGLVSWGRVADPPCGNQYPGVYTRLASYEGWIGQVLSGQVAPTEPPVDDRSLDGGGSSGAMIVLLCALLWRRKRRKL